ncbi:MAG TPA: hypothetical protein ENK57_02660 [Polyangiaceae bacterium]|nr:hypothetical protein [Polyangiaceae bacterium]
MRSLIVMHVCNLALNYTLIFGHFGAPALGATGAGVGTAIATYIGTLVYLVQSVRIARGRGFLRGLPGKETMRTMSRLSVPSGIRQVFFAGGLTVLFWIVGKVGTIELAAATVVINLMLVAYLPGIGLGMAAASLVGQALGRGDRRDAAQWGWDVSKLGVGILATLGLPMVLIPGPLLSMFIDDPATIAVGTLPLRVVGATIAVDGVGQILQAAMLGAGDSRRVMVAAIALQWLLFLPVAYAVGPWGGCGLIGIWIAQSAYRLVQAGLFAAMWRDGKWATVNV